MLDYIKVKFYITYVFICLFISIGYSRGWLAIRCSDKFP